jgi:glycosyltransferase involved in cell wall biosynthesis
MSLYLDLTEFLNNPITTGIQRIAGELCKYMPRGAATPVRLGAEGYYALPFELVEAMGRHFGNPTQNGIQGIRRLGTIPAGSKPLRLRSDDRVLVPEVTLEDRRLRFWESLPDTELARYYFIVYDLLPVIHPEFFGDWLVDICRYYRVLRRASNCGFISEQTRQDFYGRLKRTRDGNGVVLPLGSDGLGPRTSKAGTQELSRQFTVIGTIEPRKNHKLILDAFESLLRDVPGLTLSFVGSMGWVEGSFAQRVQAMAADKSSGFRFVSGADDATVRSEIERSRATIYLSIAEGYGLPPVESLWSGTPVIASRTIPSLQPLGDKGIHYVDPLTVEQLRSAVLAFLDDDYCRAKTAEAALVELPTWRDFTREVFAWCGATVRAESLMAEAF